jgi:hypothetical protein
VDLARERLRGIIEPATRVLGLEHPNAMRCQANLALVERATGNPGAEASISALRERLIDRVGEQHPIVVALQKRHYLYRIIDPHQF